MKSTLSGAVAGNLLLASKLCLIYTVHTKFSCMVLLEQWD